MEKLFSDSEIELILTHCIVDIKKSCGILFPDIFYAAFSSLHDQIFNLINEVCNAPSARSRKIAIAAPRGIGKTSIARAVVMFSEWFALLCMLAIVPLALNYKLRTLSVTS